MIRFESVSYAHPNGVVAVRDINLEIASSEVVAIVGENGAGKTTVIKHINGLLKPRTGRVTVFGRDTRHASVAELSRRVGIVFQNPDHQLFSDTVENEVSFGLRNLGFDEVVVGRRVEWALGFMNLLEYRKVAPLMLSGGEKKRLCLATVIAWNPDVLILDEPTVGQDYAQKEKLREIVKMLLTQEKTVIIVSHDIEFLWPLQPRTIVMARGRIVLDGTACEVFTNPSVLEGSNLMRPQLVELYGRLKLRPERPFPTVYDARSWVKQHCIGG